jgi:4-diphosphocytidyl-2-C-methyl-D-erythritol kinase
MTLRPARAKLNLALHVVGQRADGYHLLDSLVCFVEVADNLEISPAEEVTLTVSGPFAEGVPTDQRNLVLKAAGLFPRIKGQGAAIHLVKNLPHGAGIGGGSADAAATLQGLADLWGCDLPPRDGILSLGADVPVCLETAPVYMRGIGDEITAAPTLPPLWAVLVNPNLPLATPSVFAALTTKTNPALSAWHDDFWTWIAAQRNDLQDPAIALCPEIGTVLAELRRTKDMRLARMSGSGSTCFALYDSAVAAEKAAADLAANKPHWWVKTGAVLR